MLRERGGLSSHTLQELQCSNSKALPLTSLTLIRKYQRYGRVFSFQKYERKSFLLLPWKIVFSLNTLLIFPFLKHKSKQYVLFTFFFSFSLSLPSGNLNKLSCQSVCLDTNGHKHSQELARMALAKSVWKEEEKRQVFLESCRGVVRNCHWLMCPLVS